jgi:hypothetical protein
MYKHPDKGRLYVSSVRAADTRPQPPRDKVHNVWTFVQCVYIVSWASASNGCPPHLPDGRRSVQPTGWPPETQTGPTTVLSESHQEKTSASAEAMSVKGGAELIPECIKRGATRHIHITGDRRSPLVPFWLEWQMFAIKEDCDLSFTIEYLKPSVNHEGQNGKPSVNH